jgi:hypothetical protein
MKIEKKEGYLLFTTEEKVLSDVLSAFHTNTQKHAAENIIFNISDNLNIDAKDFSLFLKIASTKKAKGTTFVIINTTLNIDDLPEAINIVPTLQEAEDIIEMENIERELGFKKTVSKW